MIQLFSLTVFAFCISVVFTLTPESFAQQNSNVSEIEGAGKICENPSRRHANETEAQCIDRILATFRGTTSNDCNSARTKMEEARSKFAKECGNVGAPPGRCEIEFKTCSECNMADARDTSCGRRLDDADARMNIVEDEIDRQEELQDRRLASNLRMAGVGADDIFHFDREIPVVQIGFCRPYAMETAALGKEQLKDIRDDIKKLQERLNKLKQEELEIKNKMTDAQAAFDEGRKKTEEAFRQTLKDNNRSSEEANLRILEELSNISNTITQRELDIRAEEVRYYEQVAQIEKICEDEAEQKLRAERDKRNQKLQASASKVRSPQELLRLANVGRVANDEMMRRRFYEACRVNPTKFQNPIALLNKSFKVTLERIQKEIDALLDLQAQKRQELARLSQRYSQEEQEAYAKYNEAMTSLTNKYQQTIGQCQGGQSFQNVEMFLSFVSGNGRGRGRRPAAVQQNLNCTGLQGDLILVQGQIDQIMQELEDKHIDEDYYQELHSLAYAVTQRDPKKDFSQDAFNSAGTDYIGALRSTFAACDCACKNDGLCSQVLKTLKDFDEHETVASCHEPATVVQSNSSPRNPASRPATNSTPSNQNPAQSAR